MRVAIGELGIKDMYVYYKQHTPDPIPYKVFKLITEEYLDAILNLIIDEAYNFKIPNRLGYWRIQKLETDLTRLSIDWPATKKVGVRVYHLNSHSDGFKIRFLWEKKRAVLKKHSKRPYSFRLCRERKRDLAKIMKIPNGHAIYAEEIINNIPLIKI